MIAGCWTLPCCHLAAAEMFGNNTVSDDDNDDDKCDDDIRNEIQLCVMESNRT